MPSFAAMRRACADPGPMPEALCRGGQARYAARVPASILFIDMWPDPLPPGVVRDRFRDLPGCAAEHGCDLAIEHFSRVDPVHWSTRPPSAVMVSGSRSNLVDDPTEDPKD